ncbi:MAG: NAD+ synthase [Elusimicrobia bacterium]|nr:NAD+ synthase [Elusimicrobiota bacterium]
MKIALCQINSTVGDIEGNAKKILEFHHRAISDFSADLTIFPECALPGYPAEDLLLRKSFIQKNIDCLKELASQIRNSFAIVGFVNKEKGKLYNSAALLGSSKILELYSKQALPNYGVFDEKRYFEPGQKTKIFKILNVSMGISICEDIWVAQQPSICLKQSKLGAKILINISSSPFFAEKFKLRLDLLKKRVKESKCPLIYVNLVGGQDELIFDGRSMALDHKGNLIALAKSFEEDIKIVEVEPSKKSEPSFIQIEKNREDLGQKIEEIYKALVLGTKDYVEKNHFQSVLIGLSGGIDSALTAVIAKEALGKEKVIGVTMPSRYSSNETLGDAKKIAENLKITFMEIQIETLFKTYLETLAPHFKELKPDITEENLQSRIRGTILMALSNKFGSLVLTTGNKSEISVGYCTLYGDTAGGFAVLKDVPKTLVYKLAHFINEKSGDEIIPVTTIKRAPTAELKPIQKDQDSLPPYDLLDQLIQYYVEEDQGYNELLRKGFDSGTVSRVIKLIDSNEYKRRQSPPGIKITPKSFGKDRRMPMTNRFSEF